jgi:hypothetical protein
MKMDGLQHAVLRHSGILPNTKKWEVWYHESISVQ